MAGNTVIVCRHIMHASRLTRAMLMWQRTHLWTALPPLPAPARDVLATPKSIGLPLSQIWKGGRGLIHPATNEIIYGSVGA
jgi:hypothetical protein